MMNKILLKFCSWSNLSYNFQYFNLDQDTEFKFNVFFSEKNLAYIFAVIYIYANAIPVSKEATYLGFSYS